MNLPLDISANQNVMPQKATVNPKNEFWRCPFVLDKIDTDSHNDHKWFPIRVTYCREMKLKEVLDSLNIENYIPMRRSDKVVNGQKKRILQPAIHNLVFIRTSHSVIQSLKERLEEYAPMRYIMDKTKRSPLTVPEKQMNDFIKVTSMDEDKFFYIENREFAAKVGERVRITDGILSGVEGKILRIKNNKKVVVSIDDVAAAAILFVPTCHLQKLERLPSEDLANNNEPK